tara:strand:- start:4797 stop:5678 length:882 start_codon:yes stop_codon:yes gene_type:complete
MAEAAVLEEVQPQKKVLINRRNSTNSERIKKDEEELKTLVEEHKGKTKEKEVEQQTTEVEPTSAEEKSFKKRYGDLRRHQQEKQKELEDRINQLQSQLNESTKKEMSLPKSDDEIDAWTTKYPDVAAIVETIATKKAREQSKGLEDRVKEIDEMKANASREKAEVELLKLHPDFNDIRDDDAFHDWADEQPKWVQEALYENDEDARSAARAIDLYKADKGIITKKRSNTSKDAARSVNAKAERNKPQGDPLGNAIKESDVQKMSTQEYEKYSDEIMESIRSGNFIYDISGSAR